MPIQLSWDPDYSVGHDALDAQHRQILAHCEALAEAGEPAGAAFNGRLKALLALAEEHFATEEVVLRQCAYPALEEHRFEQDEFHDLVDELVAPEHFNPEELQRFLGLWWIGHVVGSAQKIRPFVASMTP